MDSASLADLAFVQYALQEHKRWYALAKSLTEGEAIALYVECVLPSVPLSVAARTLG